MVTGPWAAQRLKGQGSISLLMAAVLMSFVLHGGLAALCLSGAREPQKEEQSLFVQLISHQLLRQRQAQPEQPRKAAADQPQPRQGSIAPEEQTDRESQGGMVQLESKTAATPILEPIKDAATRKALKRIQKKIIPHWKQADPPGIGLVEVRMELDAQGGISSLWITNLQGPASLGDFIAVLLRQASPFPEAVRHLSKGTMILDCAFNVTGSTVKTATGTGDG